MTEPGQPCVMISGNAFACGDFTWMKWMSTPSISVLNCGSAFSFASQLAPVVVGRPVAGELLNRRQLHALRPICDQLTGGPTRCHNSSAQLDECPFRNVNTERTDGTDGMFFDGGHGWLLSLWDRTCSRPALLSQDAGPESTSRPCGALVHPRDMRWGGTANRMRPFSCCPRAASFGSYW